MPSATEINQMQAASGRALSEDARALNLADKAEESMGGKGFELISNTAAHPAPTGQCFAALHFVEDTIIAAHSEDATAPIVGTITGITWVAGTTLFGKFTSVTLTSGAVVAYYGVLI